MDDSDVDSDYDDLPPLLDAPAPMRPDTTSPNHQSGSMTEIRRMHDSTQEEDDDNDEDEYEGMPVLFEGDDPLVMPSPLARLQGSRIEAILRIYRLLNRRPGMIMDESMGRIRTRQESCDTSVPYMVNSRKVLPEIKFLPRKPEREE